MTHHIKAFSYAPKIPGVLNDTIRQTIRCGRKVAKFDEILFHGWKGKPYREGWSWRKKVVVTEAVPVEIWPFGILWMGEDKFFPESPKRSPRPWATLDALAKMDGIFPPTGNELGALLTVMPKISKDIRETGYSDAQIIRW